MTTIQTAALAVFGVLAAAATVAMIFQREPLRAALYMLVALAATAGIYTAMNALLLAWLQLILYAGAVMVLFITAINALPAGGSAKRARPALSLAAAAIAAALLLAELGSLASGYRTVPDPVFAAESAARLAAALSGRYAFQCELISLLILSGIVAAVSAAKREL